MLRTPYSVRESLRSHIDGANSNALVPIFLERCLMELATSLFVPRRGSKCRSITGCADRIEVQAGKGVRLAIEGATCCTSIICILKLLSPRHLFFFAC